MHILKILYLSQTQVILILIFYKNLRLLKFIVFIVIIIIVKFI